MKRRWLHISLALLVLAQPVASAATWAAMLSAQLDTIAGQAMEMSDMQMSGCHEAMPELPDCCDGMDGVHCGMDCGTVSPAVNQPLTLAPTPGHSAWTPAAVYAAPESPPASLYKPPRTS